MNKSIVISGFGGQGVMLLGNIIGMAVFREDMTCTILPAYGNEQRGGTANCTVVYDPTYVASPVSEHPDMLIAMNQPSVDRFLGQLKEGAIAVINSSQARHGAVPDGVKVYDIPADAMAIEHFGNNKAANIIIAGTLSALLGDVQYASIEEALSKKTAGKPQFAEMNRKALAMGRDLICGMTK